MTPRPLVWRLPAYPRVGRRRPFRPGYSNRSTSLAILVAPDAP